MYWQNAYGLAPDWPPVKSDGRDDIGLIVYFAGCPDSLVLAVDPDEEEPRGKEEDEENNRCMIDMLLMGMENHETVADAPFVDLAGRGLRAGLRFVSIAISPTFRMKSSS
jgi:hypothetical protein